MADWGCLSPGQYLIHDRGGKYCPAFQHTIDAAGITRVPLPPRSPDLNAYAERWVRSVKEGTLSRLILFGERSLWHALTEYMSHFHYERPHQARVMWSRYLRHATVQCERALSSVENGLVGCCNTPTVRPHKQGAHPLS
jgi:hypothetical protein